MRIAYAILTILLSAISALAQNGPGKDKTPGYAHFDFDPNVEAIVKERLKLDNELGPFKDLVKQILANPDKFAFDPEKMKDMKLDDPKLKKAVQEWAAQDPSLKQAIEDWVSKQPANKQPADLQKFQKDLKKMIDDAPPNLDKPPPPTSRPAPRPGHQDNADPVAKTAERIMKQTEEQTHLGDWLKDSPAWRQAFADLRSSMNQPDASRWNMGDWQKRLGFDEKKAFDLGADTMKRLQNMPTPNFERMNWDRKLPGIGALPTPNFGAPALPNYSGPSLPTMTNTLTWILLIALTLLVGWQMLRWTRRGSSVQDQRARLGPWPVAPAAVATRAELVQAFDYLALLTLGLTISSWNHQAVARRWSEQAPALAPLAQTLVLLYEASRYTECADALSDAERDQARQALAQLAEAL